MNKITVLIVDDNQKWCSDLKKQIDATDIFETAQPIYNGGDAIDYIESNRPDVIILDFIMPVYDGLYVVNYIKKRMSNYNPFIYILSAIGTEKTNRIVRNLDVSYYSIKPISTSAVAENITNLISGSFQDIPFTDYAVEYAAEEPVRIKPSIDIAKFVDNYLYDMGVLLYRLSTKCMHIALRMALEDESVLTNMSVLYNKISDSLNPPIKPTAVERNVRTTIANIQNASTSYFTECFPDVKSRLSNTAFINKSVYFIRLRIEGYLSDQVFVRKSSDIHSQR